MSEQEKVKNVILDSKEDIQNATSRNFDCKDFLSNELSKTSNYINKFYDLWKFAFDNVSDWEKVIEKFSCKVETSSNQAIASKITSITTSEEEILTVTPKNSKKNIPKPKKPIQNNSVDYQVIEEAEIIIEFFNKDVYDEFNKNLYDKVFKEFVHSRCENGVWCSEPSNLYLIPHTLNLTDKYGQWDKDLFYGHMKIYLKSKNETLPKSWKTDKSCIEYFKITNLVKFKTENKEKSKTTNEVTKKSFNDQIDINDFLLKFLVKHNKQKFENQLKAKMANMCINSLNDLTTLPAHSWENLKSNLGSPVIYNLLKKEIEQVRTNSKSTKNKSHKKTPGEILADIHKIKRFLFYETKVKDEQTQTELIDNIGYLSKKALKDGFKEQKDDEKFDGGPILKHIEKYLDENFATPNLPDIVKPSHGMILVI